MLYRELSLQCYPIHMNMPMSLTAWEQTAAVEKGVLDSGGFERLQYALNMHYGADPIAEPPKRKVKTVKPKRRANVQMQKP